MKIKNIKTINSNLFKLLSLPVLFGVMMVVYFSPFKFVTSSPVVTEVHYSVTPASLSEVLKFSDLVVIGNVVKIEGVKIPSQTRVGKNDIMTDVTFRIDDIWVNKTNENKEQITFRSFGGKVDNEEMIINGVPQYRLGQKVLVFLKKIPVSQDDSGGEEITKYELAARVHASFEVKGTEVDTNSQLENIARHHLFGENSNLLQIKTLVESTY